ncbi:MAG: glycosyltransferase [Lachnospiraceae bacterium]|nr:glycosyltransferase [Lachnospiraceae bacterium]
MREKDMPLVSIIIPVYNGSNYLAEAIDSALNQTYDNCEIIVINDGSNDNGATERIAKSYGNKIKYYSKENGGVASALNFGINMMEGEYFSWLSHDDIYYPEKIRKEVEAVLASGDRTILVQAEYEFYHMGTQTLTPTNYSKYYSIDEITNSVFSVLQLQLHACSALIHRSHFERVGKFDEKIYTVQDIDMWFRIFRNQKSLFIPEVLHKVREHEEAGSNTISCYARETGAAYLKLVQCFDYKEMERVFGDAAAFLCRMAGFVKSYGQSEELKKIIEILENTPQHDCKEEQVSIQQLNAYLAGISGNSKKDIAIFGAGQYGIRVKYELESRMIKPKYFIDNNIEKWGKEIDGIPCISMEEAEKRKEEMLVIVAQRTLTPALQQVKTLGFPYYIAKQEIDAKILHTFPAMSRKEEWLK